MKKHLWLILILLIVQTSGCSWAKSQKWIPFVDRQQIEVLESTEKSIPKKADSEKNSKGALTRWVPFIGNKDDVPTKDIAEDKKKDVNTKKSSKGKFTKWIPFVGGKDKDDQVKVVEKPIQELKDHDESNDSLVKWIPFLKTEEEKKIAEIKASKKKEIFDPFIEETTKPDNVNYGAVADSKKLKNGGKLLIIPFRAWTGIEATKELDQIALWMVRGISEQLKANQAPYEVLIANNANEAEYIIEGFITEKKNFSTLRSLTFRNNVRSLAVRGKMIDRKTGETIVAFNEMTDTKNKKQSHKHLGYLIGRNIGYYISSEAKKE